VKGLLVRIAIDQAYGHWNAPVDTEGRFVYVLVSDRTADHRFAADGAWSELAGGRG
jgi:hypothetical protein